MTKHIGLFSKVRVKFREASQDMATLRVSLRETFSSEIEGFRALLTRYPFQSIGLAFFAGVVFGGLLQARISRFVVLSLLGGFPLATVYGSSQGLLSTFSIGLVIMIDSFVSYSLLKVLRVLDEYPRLQPYMNRIKVRYTESSRLFVTYSGRLGVQGALAACTFLIGWWIAVVIAYIIDLDTRTAMIGIFSGLLAGGLLSWSIYEGFVRLIPDPIVLVVVFLSLYMVAGFVVGRIFRKIGQV